MAKRITPKKKLEIFKRDKFICQYCGLNASKDFEIWWHANLTVDHIDPQGGDAPSNLATACRACNSYKRNHPCKSVAEGWKYIESRRAISKEWFKNHVNHSSAIE